MQRSLVNWVISGQLTDAHLGSLTRARELAATWSQAVVLMALSACAGPSEASDMPTATAGRLEAGHERTEPLAAAEAEPKHAAEATAARSAALTSELSALQEEFKAAERDFWPTLPRRPDGSLEMSEGDSARMPSRVFLPRFQDLAERARGTATEVDALLALLDIAGKSWWPDKDTTVEAQTVQALLERHDDSPRMTELASRLGFLDHVVGAATVEAGLDALANSPHAEVRAVALKAQAERLLERDGTEGAAREVLGRLQREHAGSEPAQEAEGLLFKLDHLRVGLVAPDQEAVDQDGETFRLSDYRGKVVLLVFWGFW